MMRSSESETGRCSPSRCPTSCRSQLRKVMSSCPWRRWSGCLAQRFIWWTCWWLSLWTTGGWDVLHLLLELLLSQFLVLFRSSSASRGNKRLTTPGMPPVDIILCGWLLFIIRPVIGNKAFRCLWWLIVCFNVQVIAIKLFSFISHALLSQLIAKLSRTSGLQLL